MEPVAVGDDGGQLLCVRRVDEVDLRQLAQGDEVGEQVRVLERLDVGEVVVHVAAETLVVVLVWGRVGVVRKGKRERGVSEDRKKNRRRMRYLPDQGDRAVDANALPLEVFAKRGEEAEADLLIEDVEHVLLRAADEHPGMRGDDADDLAGGLAGPDVDDAIVGVAGRAGVEVRWRLGGGADVFDFVHQDVDALVQPRGDALVEHLFEALLFFDGRVEEVVAVRQLGGDELLLVEDVDHLLDEVADVDELEEYDQWRDASRVVLADFAGVVL